MKPIQTLTLTEKQNIASVVISEPEKKPSDFIVCFGPVSFSFHPFSLMVFAKKDAFLKKEIISDLNFSLSFYLVDDKNQENPLKELDNFQSILMLSEIVNGMNEVFLATSFKLMQFAPSAKSGVINLNALIPKNTSHKLIYGAMMLIKVSFQSLLFMRGLKTFKQTLNFTNADYNDHDLVLALNSLVLATYEE